MMKKVLLIYLFLVGAIEADARNFELRNLSLKTIRLELPNIMNPNLLPLSKSGVGLENGQKIYFDYKGHQELLLIIDKETPTILIINRILREKKKDLKG